MSATAAFQDDLLALIFHNADIANVGDAGGLRGSVTAGVFYLSVHSLSPGENGDQTTNETTYDDYTRVDVARSIAEWNITAGVVDNINEIAFPTCGATGDMLNATGIGSDLSGAGNLFLYGTLASPFAAVNGIAPTFDPGDLDITLD